MARGFLLTILTLVVLSPTPIALTQQPDERTALYTKYSEQKKGGAEEQKLAYETAKEFLAKFGSSQDERTLAVRKWVSSYERLLELSALFQAKDYEKGFALGGQVLADDPDNLYVLTKLTEAGMNSAQTGNPTFTVQAVDFARKGIQLIDSAKVKDPSPFANLSSARNFFDIALATLVLDNQPEESAKIFLRLAHTDEYKAEPSIYYYFGRALLKGEYQKLISEYKQKYEGKPSNPEQKAALDRITQIVTRIVDTYARAVALSTRPEQQETKTEVLNQLLPMYKALHNNSDIGLNELISTVLSKPMP